VTKREFPEIFGKKKCFFLIYRLQRMIVLFDVFFSGLKIYKNFVRETFFLKKK